jgi:drug/metabolite transporter (DMT)-like permease
LVESTGHMESISPALAQRKARLITLLCFIAMVLIWGSFPVAVKLGVENAPPLLFSSVRFFIAFCIMAVIAILQRKRLRITRKQHLQTLLVSLCMVSIPSSIFFAAAPYAPVSVLTLMWATAPIFTSLFNMGGVGEIRGWRLFGSLAIGACGILIVLLGRLPFWGGSWGAIGFASSGLALVGELGVLASSVIYGLGMLLAKRSNPAIPVTVLTAWQMFYSSLFITVMSLIFERGYTFHPTWTTLGALLYLTVFCSCISFFLVFWLIRRIGAIRTGYSDFIIPAITLVLSFLILGESLTWAKVGGMALVLLGVVLVEM